MAEFTLEPEELEPDPHPSRPTRFVSSGLAPTAEVPTKRTRGADQWSYAQVCPSCGVRILTGHTSTGETISVALDGRRCFTVVIESGAVPRLARSMAYVEHTCKEQLYGCESQD